MKTLHAPIKSFLIHFGLFFCIVFSVARILTVLPERADKDDFAHYYISTHMFFSGAPVYGVNLITEYDKYGFDTEKATSRYSYYPPAFFYLFRSFALLNPLKAFITWSFFSFFCLVYCLFLIKRCLIEFEKEYFFVFLVLICLSAWIYFHFYYSQANFPATALILTAFALHRSEKYSASCVIIGVAGLIKIFPFIFLPWFLLRKHKNIKSAIFRCGITAAILLAIITYTGIDNWIDYYLLSLKKMDQTTYGIFYNYSLPSLIVNLIYFFFGFRPGIGTASHINFIGTLAGFLALGIAYLFILKFHRSEEVEFGSLIIFVLLFMPYVLGHYYVLLIFPFAVAFKYLNRVEDKRFILAVLILYLILNLQHLPFVVAALGITNIGLLLFLNYFPLYGLLGFLFMYHKITESGAELKDVNPFTFKRESINFESS